MDAWELNPELSSLWLKASETLGWGMTSAEGLHDRVQAGRAPFNLYPGIWLTTEEKHGKPQGSRVVLGTARCVNFAAYRGGLDRPAVHPSSSVDRKGLQTALGKRRCLPSCRTKGFPASVNFQSKL
jgi:hypothetical protein